MNYSVAVQERNGTVLFLRKIIRVEPIEVMVFTSRSWQAFPEAVIHRAKQSSHSLSPQPPLLTPFVRLTIPAI